MYTLLSTSKSKTLFVSNLFPSNGTPSTIFLFNLKFDESSPWIVYTKFRCVLLLSLSLTVTVVSGVPIALFSSTVNTYSCKVNNGWLSLTSWTDTVTVACDELVTPSLTTKNSINGPFFPVVSLSNEFLRVILPVFVFNSKWLSRFVAG